MSLRKITGLFLLLLIFSSVSASAQNLLGDEAKKYYAEGIAAQKKGDVSAATTAYQKALLLFKPGDLDYQKSAYNNMAVISAQNGDLENAKAMFEEILNLDPDYKEANFNLGILFSEMGDYRRALEYFRKGIPDSEDFIIEDLSQKEKLK
jgi:Flp pilus assembly protein TadD